jgi:hypothetical protein
MHTLSIEHQSSLTRGGSRELEKVESRKAGTYDYGFEFDQERVSNHR